MIQPKISVIIPVYNTQDYLEETLMSILNQTMIGDIEVLMIDDGSTDNSRHIIEKYALDYDNFHAYHKENEGQGIARNYALTLAKGEYVHFLDSDDYLPVDAYEKLYDAAQRNHDDIVICNVSHFSFYNNWDDILFKNSYNNLKNNLNSTTLNDYLDMLWDTITCNKLYNRHFLEKNNIRFIDRKIFFEDIPFSLESYLLADSITILREELYYWRFRNDESSTTQQDLDVKNFKDRLEILRVCNDLFDKYNVDDNIRNFTYVKWLNHDLKFFLKRIDSYPDEYHTELIDEVYSIVKLMPRKSFDNLTSYQKVLYDLVLNKDYENTVLFAPLENDLYENPQVPSFLDDKYKSYFDFDRDIQFEQLNGEVLDVSNDKDNLYVEFEATLYFLSSQKQYTVHCELTDSDGVVLRVDNVDGKISIPFDSLENKSNVKIKIIYDFDDFKKEAYLKIRKRRVISSDEFDIDVNFRRNSYLYLDFKNKTDNEIKISDISFNLNEFILKGESQDKINEMIMENTISFDKYYYSVKYIDESSFYFKIPYEDVLNAPVKKWLVNCEDSLNNVKLSQKSIFFTETHKIKFSNSKNKIRISNEIHNPINSLYSLQDKINKLNSQKRELKKNNSKLEKSNAELKSKCLELEEKNTNPKEDKDNHKSRGILKITDKFKK